MKRTKLYQLLYLCLITLLNFSCAKDEGNYSYTVLDKVSFPEEKSDTTIFIQQGKALTLSPEVVYNGDANDLSYEWFVYLNSASASYVQDSTLIAKTKSLNYTVSPDIFVLGENYKLTYKVTNSKTGLAVFRFYQLAVQDLFTQGWIFLEDRNGKADLSMILRNGTLYHDIYSGRNANYPIANPKSFSISPQSISDGVAQDGKKFYIVGASDAIELDGNTMKKRFDYAYLFFQAPATIKPEYIAWGGAGGNNLGLLINDGKLYPNMVGGFPGAKKFGAEMKSSTHEYTYNLAAQHISGANYSDTYNVFVFDRLNRCFYAVTSSNLNAFDAASQNTALFDMNNVGMDLIKLDSSNVSTVRNAIMRTTDGSEAYLLQFRTTRTAAEPTINVAKQHLNAPGLIKATDLSCSTLSPHIFYVADAKLYRYEVTSNSYTVEYQLPTNETVSKIKFERHGYGQGLPRLIVATWNGTEGKVYYFKVSPTGTIQSLDKTFTGFGRIIDLAYKY
ncbi:hypothetical protein BCY89_20010 [Sphingobacterium siyangense]|uniref:PKD family protein n=1 Tax=Sphingobacterium siyangense TaxID=459529 RepID=A0A420FB61_9SPHI|nr:PKD-like family lipoprotein [Sphingobacterium siyangense]QRY57067.1 hypothetical protein JVX97_24235 [Sphingobacterium siyangense]RKF30091.1 hypothetical protein BCY89_20010 [Sphingobacterium siyangense]